MAGTGADWWRIQSAMPNPAKPTCEVPKVDPALVCDECGAFGAFEFGGVTLCVDCYAGKGSCCPEFGKDDLWTRGVDGVARAGD